MNKNFDQWNVKKQLINRQKPCLYFHEREVWWCSLGVNVGSEQDGTGKNFDRPVVIIKDFNRKICLTLALTSEQKSGEYYFNIGLIKGRENWVILSQVRLVDSRRLVRKIATLDEAIYDKLKTALLAVLFDKLFVFVCPPNREGEAEAIVSDNSE